MYLALVFATASQRSFAVQHSATSLGHVRLEDKVCGGLVCCAGEMAYGPMRRKLVKRSIIYAARYDSIMFLWISCSDTQSKRPYLQTSQVSVCVTQFILREQADEHGWIAHFWGGFSPQLLLHRVCFTCCFFYGPQPHAASGATRQGHRSPARAPNPAKEAFAL